MSSFLFGEPAFKSDTHGIPHKHWVFGLFFHDGLISVQSSHQRDAGPKTRTSLCGVRFLFARVSGVVSFLSSQHSSVTLHPGRALHFVECVSFFARVSGVVSFLSSQHSSVTLDPRNALHFVKCVFFLPAFLARFHFRSAQRQAAAPKSRISPQWGSRFLFSAVLSATPPRSAKGALAPRQGNTLAGK